VHWGAWLWSSSWNDVATLTSHSIVKFTVLALVFRSCLCQGFWWFMFYSNFLIGVVVQKWSNKCTHCSHPIACSSMFCSCTHSACANGVCGPKGNCMGWLQWHRHNWASFAWDTRRWRNMSRLGSQQRKRSFSNKFATTMHESSYIHICFDA